MSIKLLIDGITRQTMVLVAHISTAAGLRAPLAHVASQVFFDLVTELERQGVGRKVAADMFGMALRTYQRKVQRVTEAVGEEGRSLWEAVLTYVQDKGTASRGEVMMRFALDGADTVASVLHDLSTSGLLRKTGRGSSSHYHAVSDDEREVALSRDRTGALPALVWIAVYRLRHTTVQELAEQLRVSVDAVRSAVAELEAEGRVEWVEVDGSEMLTSRQVIVPVGQHEGWEAAIMDHFQAVATAIIAKLRTGQTHSAHADKIGGSTWSMYVWPGHPHEEEVLDLLATTRASISPVRAKVTAYNQQNEPPEHGGRHVMFYIGQNVMDDDDIEQGDES